MKERWREGPSEKKKEGEGNMKRVLLVAEKVDGLREERERKKVRKTRKAILGFQIVKHGTFKWLGTGLQGELVGLKRGATKAGL